MDDKFTVPCFLCGEPFTPDPERVKAWAESGRPFDPTDWDCGLCFISPEDYEEHFASADPDDPATFGAEQLLLETLTEKEERAILDKLIAHDALASAAQFAAAGGHATVIGVTTADLYAFLDDDPSDWPFNNAEPFPFHDDRDFDTHDDEQPTYTCEYCQSALTYFDPDILLCPNCSAQYRITFDTENQLYYPEILDAYDQWFMSFQRQQRTIEDLQEQLERERAILDDILAAKPEIPSTTVHPVHNDNDIQLSTVFPHFPIDDDISEVAAADAINTLINFVRHTVNPDLYIHETTQEERQ